MTKDCNCLVKLELIEEALKQASTIPHDSQLLGTSVIEAVEDLLKNQQARIRAQHERSCIPHPTQSRMIVSSEERQQLRGLA